MILLSRIYISRIISWAPAFIFLCSKLCSGLFLYLSLPLSLSLSIYIYTYIHVYICICVYTYIYIYIYISYICIYVWIHVRYIVCVLISSSSLHIGLAIPGRRRFLVLLIWRIDYQSSLLLSLLLSSLICINLLY